MPQKKNSFRHETSTHESPVYSFLASFGNHPVRCEMIRYPDTCLFYISHCYNPTNLLPTPQCRLVHNKLLMPPPPTSSLPLPASAWPIFTQWQGSHSVQGDRRGAGWGWLTAVPERMLRDDGWPSRYVMS